MCTCGAVNATSGHLSKLSLIHEVIHAHLNWKLLCHKALYPQEKYSNDTNNKPYKEMDNVTYKDNMYCSVFSDVTKQWFFFQLWPTGYQPYDTLTTLGSLEAYFPTEPFCENLLCIHDLTHFLIGWLNVLSIPPHTFLRHFEIVFCVCLLG